MIFHDLYFHIYIYIYTRWIWWYSWSMIVAYLLDGNFTMIRLGGVTWCNHENIWWYSWYMMVGWRLHGVLLSSGLIILIMDYHLIQLGNPRKRTHWITHVQLYWLIEKGFPSSWIGTIPRCLEMYRHMYEICGSSCGIIWYTWHLHQKNGLKFWFLLAGQLSTERWAELWLSQIS